MTLVNCPAMSSSEMGVAEESPSQGGGFGGWKASEAASLSAPVFAASEEEEEEADSWLVLESGVLCPALGGL